MVLLFNGFDFISGTYSTIRRGVKWSLAIPDTEFGFYCADAVNQHDENANLILRGFAEITLTKVKKFCDLTELDMENNVNKATLSSIGAAMRNVYDSFDDNEIITVVTFNLEKA